MRILVGTLYSGENEFEECLAAIQSQTYHNFDHLVIKDLPQHLAHKKLFSHFMANSTQYDLLIKVDADTVLNSNELFYQIVQKFDQNSWLDVLVIAIDDFFTARRIAGLLICRNTVTWNFEKETAFPDVPNMAPDRYFFDTTDLAPAAIHCKNPSPFQSFHYGVHRGIKSLQRIHSTTHWSGIQNVWKNFLETKDVRMGLAVIGAELVYAGCFTKLDADYTKSVMFDNFKAFETMDSNQVKRKIHQLRFRNWGFLPNDLRRRLIRNKRSIYFQDDSK